LATDGRIAYQKNYLGGLKTDVFPNEKGDILAEALGGKDILLLANHGCIVAGRSIAQAMEDLYYLERAAMNQIIAMSTGSPLRLVPPNPVLVDFQAAAQEPNSKADYADVFLAAWIAELCVSEPDFAQLDDSLRAQARL
jgi:ribulose-5-phosphate 4-epimerase/fuculose-1-phosphate aldolase